MGENTKIEWAHHTFNPWVGCTKVSAGCDHCYAETLMDTRHHRVTWGGARSRTSEGNWRQPLKWDREAKGAGERRRVFCASLADVFDNQVPVPWRVDLFELIRRTPNLDWLLLTKRPQNITKMITEARDGPGASVTLMNWLFDWAAGDFPANVWLGTTVENQEEADRRIPHLLDAPARVRFLSCEPLLGALDLNPNLYPRIEGAVGGDLHWVIAGGESGPKARPMHPDWARSLRDQCQAAGVAFHFKQWGEWLPGTQFGEAQRGLDPNPEQSRFDCMDWDGEQFEEAGGGWMDDLSGGEVFRVGKRRAGRLVDGRTWDEVPA